VITRGNTCRFKYRYTNAVLAIMLVSVLLLVTTTSNKSAYATHVGTFSDLWGIEAAIIAKMHHFDPSTDTSTAIPRVPL
jgi:hypothetical protein